MGLGGGEGSPRVLLWRTRLIMNIRAARAYKEVLIESLKRELHEPESRWEKLAFYSRRCTGTLDIMSRTQIESFYGMPHSNGIYAIEFILIWTSTTVWPPTLKYSALPDGVNTKSARSSRSRYKSAEQYLFYD